jgi:hypothetical protein
MSLLRAIGRDIQCRYTTKYMQIDLIMLPSSLNVVQGY